MEVTTEASRVEFLEVSKELDDLLMKQEIFWAQRSRVSWLKHGDKNGIFFFTLKHHNRGGEIIFRGKKF